MFVDVVFACKVLGTAVRLATGRYLGWDLGNEVQIGGAIYEAAADKQT